MLYDAVIITTKALSVAIIIQQNTDKTQRERQKKYIQRHSGQGLTNKDYVQQTSCNQDKQTNRHKKRNIQSYR